MKERPILFSAPMVQAIRDGRKTQTRRLVKPMRGRQSEWLTEELINKVPHGEIINGGWQMHHPKAGTRHTIVGITVDEPYDSPLGWIACPNGKVGDRLWIKESFYEYGSFVETGNRTKTYRNELTFVEQEAPTISHGIRYVYVSDAEQYPLTTPLYPTGRGWHKRPSIFMPRETSRITLEITNVRVERLQEISGRDVLAEGVDNGYANPKMGVRWENAQRMAFAKLWDEINGKKAPWAENPYVWVLEFKKL